MTDNRKIKKPVKFTFEEFKKMYTPFFINDEYETEVDSTVNRIVDSLHDKMANINTIEDLLEYVETDEDSLDNILSLLSFSAEKFKRIVSMIRIREGANFATEWGLEKIRNEMVLNVDFGRKIGELLLNGATDPEFTGTIPKFYLDNLVINDMALEQLKNKYQLKKLVKQKRDGKYNNDVGDHVENLIAHKLDELKDKYGITYEREKFVSWITRNIDFSIPNAEDPYVIIEVSYQITTGSAMTTKREVEVNTSEEIRRHNIQNSKDIAFVNFIEGAGWIGRQSDLRRIVQCSDYVINIKSLDMIESIIVKHVPRKYFHVDKPKLID